MRFDRMSGLDEKQLDELEERVSTLLEKPWDKDTGRPRELTFREALVVTSGYMRQNIIEDVWADIFDVVRYSKPLTGAHLGHITTSQGISRHAARGN